MHQLNTQKSIIDCSECCGCVTSHRTGWAELVCGLDKPSRAAILAYGKTILWSSLHQLQCTTTYTLYFSCFLSQTADPPLSKAMKVAKLQLAYKPGSSSSQRALLLSALSISRFPFLSFPISSFLVPGFTCSLAVYV